MDRSQQAFTLIEVLVALAVLGVILGMTALSLRPDRTAVNQAARGLAANVTRARLEAIKFNTYAGLSVDAAQQSYMVWVDTDGNGVFTAGTDRVLQQVRLGQGELARVTLGSGTTLSGIVFDSRGIPQNQGGGSVVFTGLGNSYSKTVVVNAQGRAKVQ
jgi:type IV fimbrial biogenesis protein FimT